MSQAQKVSRAYKARKASGGGMPTRGGFDGFMRELKSIIPIERKVLRGWNGSVREYTFLDGSKLWTIGRGLGRHVSLKNQY